MNATLGRRILIIGDTNAGKSTLGARLAGELGVPFVDLDALFWLPNWQQREGEDFKAQLREHLRADGRWVAAGNYADYEVHWLRAETIVWLDYPLRITVPRIVERSWRRWRRKELLWGSNYERLADQFMLWDQERSLIGYVLRNHRRKRAKYEALMHDPRFSHVEFIRLERPGDTEAWVGSVLAARVSVSA